MGSPILGEIRMAAFDFPPRGFLPCNGQELSISIHQAIFSLIGTTYGGDGHRTFCLPNLNGRVPIHASHHTYLLGSAAGTVAETLRVSQLPAHSHPFFGANNEANKKSPVDHLPASTEDDVYANELNGNGKMKATTTDAGGSLPHDNRQPTLAINFVIAVEGIYPTGGESDAGFPEYPIQNENLPAGL